MIRDVGRPLFRHQTLLLPVILAVGSLVTTGCAPAGEAVESPSAATTAVETATEGVRMIPIDTPSGSFEVWTRTVGENPTARVLLLHGGPGATHEYLLAVGERLAADGIEAIFYDQLGSHYSDQPDDTDLWRTPRFVDEVEQVRQALGLGPDDFYLYGHSWGGILAIEYALAHPDALEGLIISNMMASIPEYNRYAEEVLMPQIDPAVLAEIKAIEAAEDTENPRYMELLMEHHYVHHFLRRPPEEWPAEVVAAFDHLNHDVYVLMQGPSELGASGRLLEWDRTADLSKIEVPTLVIGARHDTMDPAHMEWMASELPNGRYLYCPDGSHVAHYDDQEVYMAGLIEFIRDVNGD